MSEWRPDRSLNARVGGVMNYGAYKGAERGEWDSRWDAVVQSPDNALAGDLDVLLARSQDLHRNSAIISGATQTLTVGVVGRGIKPKSRAWTGVQSVDESIRETLETEWVEFARNAGMDGVTSFYDMQHQLVQAMIRDGECLAIWPEDSGKLKCDLVSASRVATPSDAKNLDIRHGVEWNRRKVNAYWVASSEEANSTRENFYRFVPNRNGRINCRMVSRPLANKIGLSRVPPLISPAIGTIKDLETYVQAERRRAIASSKITGVLTAPDPEKIERAWANLQTGNDIANNYKSRSFGTLFDAQIMSLATGESMQLFNPNNTNTGFGTYIEVLLKQIANCYGLPWSICFNLLDKINYSNARTNKTTARRVYEIWQRVVIDRFCQPTWDLFVSYLWAEGKLPGVREITPDLLRCDWRTDVERWIDPQKEIAAASEALAYGLASHYSICSDMGEDPMELLEQEIAYVVKKKAMMELAGLDDADMGYVPKESMQKSESESESTSVSLTPEQAAQEDANDE